MLAALLFPPQQGPFPVVPRAVTSSLLFSCSLYKGMWSMHGCSVWCRFVTMDMTPQEVTLVIFLFIDLASVLILASKT